MGLGSDTTIINGQRMITPVRSQFAPLSYGNQTTGVPQVSPTSPPFIGGAAGGNNGQAGTSVGGYGTADNNAQVTSIAAAHPYNLKVSPVLWAVAALVGSLVLLNAIHWRKTTLESFHADGSVGAGHAAASESI